MSDIEGRANGQTLSASSRSHEVNAGPRVLQAKGHPAPEERLVFRYHVGVEPFNTPFSVVSEESAKDIRLIVIPTVVEPKGWIFEWEKNVVEMDEHTSFQMGQDIEEQHLYVASALDNVA